MKTVICSAAVACVVTAASAGTVYTDFGSWSGAAGGPVVTEDYTGVADQIFSIGDNVVNGITYTVNGTVNTTTGIFGEHFEGFLVDPDVHSITVTFGSAQMAWGADFTSATTGDLLAVTANGNLYNFSDHLSGSGDGFLGVVEGSGFTSITFSVENLTTFGEWFTMDNLSTVAVPAPGAAALLGLGGLVAIRRRR